MDILAADFSEGAMVILRDLSFLAVATSVNMTSVDDFVENVRLEAGKNRIKHLYVLDHGITYTNLHYRATPQEKVGQGPQWSKVKIEFGNDRVELKNFAQYKPKLLKLRAALGRGSHVIFLNCFIGRDPALLQHFTDIWQCPVSGSMETQHAYEPLNMWGLRWTTTYPDRHFTQSSTNPVWGTR